MARHSASASRETLDHGMRRAVVTFVEFSSACMLFGVESLQTALTFKPGKGIPKAIDDLEGALDSMASELSHQMTQKNRETMDSAASAAERIVQRSFDALAFVDPRRVLKTAVNFVQRSTEAVSDIPSDLAVEHDDKPQLAVDALVSVE